MIKGNVMKRIKKLNIDFRIYGIIQFFLLIVPILSLVMLYFIALQKQMSINELMTLSPVSNMIFLVAMINCVCFIELYYFKKNLLNNIDFEVICVNLTIIALIEFLILNMPVFLCILYFINSTLKKNNKTLKNQFITVKDNNALLVPIINFSILLFSVMICYKLLML